MTDKLNVTLEELKQLEETSEKIAREIRMLSRAFKKIASGGLKEETIVVLLANMTNVGKPDIRSIMLALREMEKNYTHPESKIMDKKNI